MKSLVQILLLMCVWISLFSITAYCGDSKAKRKTISEFRNVGSETITPTKKKRDTGSIPYFRGVNYVSWTMEDYPYRLSSFKVQTAGNSQGIAKVSITKSRPFKCKFVTS